MWRLSSSAPVTLRSWDDEFVLYDRASGDTHQLTWLGAGLLQYLQPGAADEAELAAHFSSDLEPAEKALAVAQVAAVLRQFQALGLIETDAG